MKKDKGDWRDLHDQGFASATLHCSAGLLAGMIICTWRHSMLTDAQYCNSKPEHRVLED